MAKKNIIKFTGNRRPVAKSDEPCIVIILPVVRIDHYRDPPDGKRRRRRRRA